MAKKNRAQILEEFPMLQELGEKTLEKKPDKVKTNSKRREICDFAHEHNLVIHPGRGYKYYIEGYFMFGCCPCDATRQNCPCDEAVEEVQRIGHCKCRLLWRSFKDFKEEMLKEA